MLIVESFKMMSTVCKFHDKSIWNFLNQCLFGTAKYLHNNKNSFLTYKKRCNASLAWKNILDNRDLIKKGLKWSFRNDKDIYFWKDIWLSEFRLFTLFSQIKEMISTLAKKFVVLLMINKNWVDNLAAFLPSSILSMIRNTPIPISNMVDKVIGSLTPLVFALLNPLLGPTILQLVLILKLRFLMSYGIWTCALSYDSLLGNLLGVYFAPEVNWDK